MKLGKKSEKKPTAAGALTSAVAAPLHKADPWLDPIIEKYGDLLYDLCQSLLWSSDDSPEAYRRILRRIQKSARNDRFEKYERAWILQIAIQELKSSLDKVPRRLTPAEQVMLDSNPDPKARLRHFDSYFHRLDFQSQALLLLRDKYRFPIAEVSAVLNAPEESLELKRASALRQLETWVWSTQDAVL